MRNRTERLKKVIKSIILKDRNFIPLLGTASEGYKVSYLFRILQFNHLLHSFIALNTVINLECLYYFQCPYLFSRRLITLLTEISRSADQFKNFGTINM